MLDVILGILCVAAVVVAALCARQLQRWERLLSGARIVIAFKGKNKLTPRLIDFVRWAESLDSDKRVNGQTIYKLGGTTIALIKPDPRGHGKAKTTTIKTDS